MLLPVAGRLLAVERLAGTVLRPGVNEQVAVGDSPVEVQQDRLRFRLDDRDRDVVPSESADRRARCPERMSGEFDGAVQLAGEQAPAGESGQLP
jgi:hypothetical protein